MKMKMRFWQKTYLFTLILFLLCLNAGILSLTVYTHRKNVEATEASAAAEQYYAAMSFERDYNALMEAGAYGSPALLMQSFGAHYAGKGVYLAFEQDGEIVYSGFPGDVKTAQDSLVHLEIDGERHILISSRICDGRYTLLFAKNVETLNTEFRSLMVLYTLTAVGVSLVLAVSLYFILKRLSMPLEKLRAVTGAIEGGDFTVTAEERGNDEFTLLAKSFNAMLAKINEQMDALRLSAERNQMLVDNMAHELRTPLTSIHGYAEYFEKAIIPEERKIVAAKYIMSETERLQKISEILLDSAYVRGNPPEMGTLSVEKILFDTAERLKLKADSCGVTLLCEGDPVTVCGNETLLSMLFYNLTENAIKACAEGGTVKLSCSGGEAAVEDDGKGMTEEQLLHVTEPFYRTDKSRSRAEGGAGLGLALCKQIADVHGALLRFDSKPGEGTRILVTFTSRQ